MCVCVCVRVCVLVSSFCVESFEFEFPLHYHDKLSISSLRSAKHDEFSCSANNRPMRGGRARSASAFLDSRQT